MIPLTSIRAAHRHKTVGYIAAEPSPAVFRSATLYVRSSEIAKSREMRQAGFTPGATHSCQIALPFGADAPQPAKEQIAVLDLADQWLNYDIVGVTPLQGSSCYRLDLKVRNGAPAAPRPPRA
jgi:hypothetical protein